MRLRSLKHHSPFSQLKEVVCLIINGVVGRVATAHKVMDFTPLGERTMGISPTLCSIKATTHRATISRRLTGGISILYMDIHNNSRLSTILTIVVDNHINIRHLLHLVLVSDR
jgi:hypothetical protein